jgi:hypothetical protein
LFVIRDVALLPISPDLDSWAATAAVQEGWVLLGLHCLHLS